MSNYTSFKAEWTGRRVDWDKVYQHQCVDLILQYAHQVLGVSGVVRGNAIDYWTKPSQALLTKCDRIGTTNCQQGDIVILRTAGRDDVGGDGHIGILDSQDAGNVWLLEQNAVGSGSGTGRDAIGVYRAIPKSRIAGVLRLKPVPVAPKISNPCTYSSPVSELKLTKLNPTNWYNLNAPTFNDIRPVTTLAENTPFPVGGYAYRDNNTYAMTPDDFNRARAGDLSTNNGINDLDLKAVPQPVAPVIPPPPYVLPAAPLTVRPVEPYDLLTDLFYYGTLDDVRADRNALGGLDMRKKYIVYDRDGQYINLTLNNQKNQNLWINGRLNVVPEPLKVVPVVPVATPVIVTPPLPINLTNIILSASKDIPTKTENTQPTYIYDWIRGDRQPVYFHTLNAVPQTYKDLEKPTTTVLAGLPVNKDIKFSMMTFKNGINYYIPTASMQNGNRHGIPETMLRELGVRLPVVKPKSRLDHNNDGRTNMEDITTLMYDYGDKYFKPGLAVVTKTIKSVNGGRFIDGFREAINKDKVNK